MVVIDRPLRKDAKPEEYDMNMHRNDVYDGIRCEIDWLFSLIIFDYMHYIEHVVFNWPIVDDIMISKGFNIQLYDSTWYCV